MMRLAAFVWSFSCLLYHSATALRCLECAGVSTEADCRAQGSVRQCEFNEDACEIELRRHEGWGGSLKIYKHCKQSRACDNNYVQNPRSAWVPSQCNPEDFNSVCRCCCFTDECNVANENCFGGTGCGSLPTFISSGSISCTAGKNYDSVCTVTCNPNTELIGKSTTVCRRDGTWSNPLPRCGGLFCEPKPLQYGWYTCSGGYQSGSTCVPNCWPGYKPSGPKSITCRRGSWDNIIDPACRPRECPVLGNVAGGNITCSNKRYAQSRCQVTCDEGRRLDGIMESYCQDNGKWSHPLPTCERILCPPRGTVMNGVVACTAGVEIGSSCSATCDNGFTLAGAATSVCLPTGEWSEPLPKCVRVTCPRRRRLTGGTIRCTDESYVGSTCTATCLGGTQLVGAEVFECLASGKWSAPLPSCRRIVCPDRGEVAQGDVSCSRRNLVGSVCTVRCHSGSQLVGEVRSQCLPTGEWNFPLPECQIITCPLLDFSSEFGSMTCTNDNVYRSVCSFSCDRGYSRVGSPRLRCLRSGEWNTNMPFCRFISCPPRGFVENGDVFCSDTNNVDSICVANCNEGFEMIGESDSICLGNGRWSTTLPECTPILCPLRISFPRGSVTCTEGNAYESVCTASCASGSAMVGSPFSLCLENGEWDFPLPECEPQPCPLQDPLRHGNVFCSDSSNLGSVCIFECRDEGYELYPADRTTLTCEANQLWSDTRPCCSRQCPPYAVMDLVVVLDSSSSIGSDNWGALTGFVRQVLRSFIVQPDVANMAIFRYNRNVDTKTQVFLNSYPGNIDELIAALDRIPYDGSGTFTGKALKHALDVSLTTANGNRPEVPDVVLVITDGRAADDVKTPADALRAAGATVLALGIEPPRGSLDRDQLLQIAGDPANLVIAAGGFEGLDATFALTISSTICGDPCE